MISKKCKWISDNAWRGRTVPIHAVAGANDTGTWDDSPCPSHLVKEEIDQFKSKLRKEGIRFRSSWGRTSNVFCNTRYVLTDPKGHKRAREIAKEHARSCHWFFMEDCE